MLTVKSRLVSAEDAVEFVPVGVGSASSRLAAAVASHVVKAFLCTRLGFVRYVGVVDGSLESGGDALLCKKDELVSARAFGRGKRQQTIVRHVG